MRDPKLLISALLDDELKIRINARKRAEWTEEDRDILQDYDDDITNVKEAISLWEKLRFTA